MNSADDDITILFELQGMKRVSADFAPVPLAMAIRRLMGDVKLFRAIPTVPPCDLTGEARLCYARLLDVATLEGAAHVE